MVVTGLVGGLVSSTAVTLSFAKTSREERLDPSKAQSLAAGLLLSWTVMFVRILVARGRWPIGPASNRSVAPMVAMGWRAPSWLAWRITSRVAPRGTRRLKASDEEPFQPPACRKLRPTVHRGVAAALKLAQAYLPTNGVLAVAGAGGLDRCRRHHAVDGGVLANWRGHPVGRDRDCGGDDHQHPRQVRAGSRPWCARAGWRVIVATVLILGAGAIAIIAA